MSFQQALKSDEHRPKYSIIIPAYNEGMRVGSTLEKVLAHIADQGWDAEIIVVDDGSSDDTPEIIRRYAATNPRLRILENPDNRGKGYSVRNGMLHAQGEILLFSDADLSSPIQEASKLFAAIEGGVDIAIGSRWLRRDLQTQRQPVYRQFLGRVFNVALRITLGLNFKDTQCGFKAFTRRAASTIFPLQRIERWGFDPELLYLAGKFRLAVAEIPVAWAHREGTRLNPIRDGLKMFIDVLRIRWNSISGKYAVGKIV
jgi:dolichyl-phosphate beta-glucosyltransferase